MKKIVAIFLLSIYLFSISDITELLKVTIIVEHFQEHKKTGNSLSLLNFLVKHYITDSINDKDHNRDMQLPYKSHKSIVSNGSIVFIVTPIKDEIFPSVIEENNLIIAQYSFVALNYHSLVWHPPKLS